MAPPTPAPAAQPGPRPAESVLAFVRALARLAAAEDSRADLPPPEPSR